MKTRSILVAALALSAAFASACKRDESKSKRTDDAAASVVTITPTPPDAGPTTSDAGPTTSAVPRANLKSFFPKDGAGGYKRVFAADKEGYVEATLQKDGKEVAILSIADAERLAYAKAKFESATDKLEGFPLMTVGKDLSTVLVKDRFQVKVLSKTLDPEARKAILATFDLKGLGT